MAVKAVAEGVAKVPMPKTRLRQGEDPPAGVATKKSVHIESVEVAGAKQKRKEESTHVKHIVRLAEDREHRPPDQYGGGDRSTHPGGTLFSQDRRSPQGKPVMCCAWREDQRPGFAPGRYLGWPNADCQWGARVKSKHRRCSA